MCVYQGLDAACQQFETGRNNDDRLLTRGAFGNPDKSVYPIPVSVTQNEDRYFYFFLKTLPVPYMNRQKRFRENIREKRVFA